MDFHVESQHLHFSSEKEEREAAPLPHYSNSYFFLLYIVVTICFLIG